MGAEGGASRRMRVLPTGRPRIAQNGDPSTV